MNMTVERHETYDNLQIALKKVADKHTARFALLGISRYSGSE